MRLTMRFKKRIMHIFVDSSSTHNFLDAKAAKSLRLVPLNINQIPIMVVDSRTIHSSKAVKKFSCEMQEYCFMADFYIILFKGCEMVLRVKWLAQLGDITWNF